MPSKTHPRVSAHAIDRLRERFGIALDYDEWEELTLAMKHRNRPAVAVMQARDSKGMQFFFALVRGHVVQFVWSPWTEVVVTVQITDGSDPRAVLWNDAKVKVAAIGAKPEALRTPYGYKGRKAKTRWDPDMLERRSRGKWRGADDDE